MKRKPPLTPPRGRIKKTNTVERMKLVFPKRRMRKEFENRNYKICRKFSSERQSPPSGGFRGALAGCNEDPGGGVDVRMMNANKSHSDAVMVEQVELAHRKSHSDDVLVLKW
jgi:hypothetical protein